MNYGGEKDRGGTERRKHRERRACTEQARRFYLRRPVHSGYIQKNTIYPCAAAEAVERDDVKIATEKYPGVADFIINVDELHTTPEKAKARGEAVLAFARMLAKSK